MKFSFVVELDVPERAWKAWCNEVNEKSKNELDLLELQDLFKSNAEGEIWSGVDSMQMHKYLPISKFRVERL